MQLSDSVQLKLGACGEQVPTARQTLELMRTPLGEFQPRARYQVRRLAENFAKRLSPRDSLPDLRLLAGPAVPDCCDDTADGFADSAYGPRDRNDAGRTGRQQ